MAGILREGSLVRLEEEKKVPATFWRTNRIWSPDLFGVVWKEQQNLFI